MVCAAMNAVSVPVDVAELALGLALPDVESDGLADGDGSVVAGVGEVESLGLGLVSVGDGLGLGEVGLGVGLGLGLVSVGVGVGLVGVGVGDGLGAGDCSGSHCGTTTLAKRAVTTGGAAAGTSGCISGAADADVASTADAATRTPPVTKPAATGRTCAKRMINAPASAARCYCGTTIQYGVATSGAERPPRFVRPPLDTMPGARRYSPLPGSPRYPVTSRLITMFRKPPDPAYYWDDPHPLGGSNASAEHPATSARLDPVSCPGRPPNSPSGAKPQVRHLRPAPLAQSAERLHGKEKVYGSIP